PTWRGAAAVPAPGPAGSETPRPCCLDTDQPHVRVVEEACEEADRVRAAAHAGDDCVRKPTLGRENLLTCLAADDGLQLTDELGVGMWSNTGADHVVGRLDVRDPVADRLACRLLERPRAELDGTHLWAEEAHGRGGGGCMSRHVRGAQVDDAVEPEPRADRRGGDAVLARSGLRDDALLAQAPCDERLPERVVDLVGACVTEVLTLEVDGLPFSQALRAVERSRPPDVV